MTQGAAAIKHDLEGRFLISRELRADLERNFRILLFFIAKIFIKFETVHYYKKNIVSNSDLRII